MENTADSSSTTVKAPAVTLLPLIENGANEEVINMLSALIGDDERANATALLITSGLHAFLVSGSPKAAYLCWGPIIIARRLKKEYGGQAHRKAVEAMALTQEKQDEESFSLYRDVCQILICDPEQEKFTVDDKK